MLGLTGRGLGVIGLPLKKLGMETSRVFCLFSLFKELKEVGSAEALEGLGGTRLTLVGEWLGACLLSGLFSMFKELGEQVEGPAMKKQLVGGWVTGT